MSLHRLSELITDLETKIPFSEKLNTSISQVAVGWHIQHAVLVSSQIIKAVGQSNPKDYKGKFNLKRMIVYTLNKIPRGKAKAPKSVLPNEVFDAAHLAKDIQLLKLNLLEFSKLNPDNYFEHPHFGSLNLKATIKMLKIHTKHHIDIINDILKA